jgi:hypothetical protein
MNKATLSVITLAASGLVLGAAAASAAPATAPSESAVANEHAPGVDLASFHGVRFHPCPPGSFGRWPHCVRGIVRHPGPVHPIHGIVRHPGRPGTPHLINGIPAQPAAPSRAM